MTAPVTVYTTSTCPWCDRVKDYLTRNNVPFQAIDVARDYNAAMEMVRRSGQQGVPVVATADEVFVGFDQARLARLVERYATPRRAPLGVLAADAETYFARHPEAAALVPEGTKGVYVGRIRPDSVAERAGLRRGDVIVGFAGKRVRTMAALDQFVETLKAGDQATVRYLRGTEEATATLKF